MYYLPAAKAVASLVASSANIPAAMLTTGEKVQRHHTGNYPEAVELMRKMEHSSRRVKVVQFGITSEDRAMYALIIF